MLKQQEAVRVFTQYWTKSFNRCELAAWQGSLEALKEARKDGCAWGDTRAMANRRQRYEICEWVTANGCPQTRPCDLAAEQGRLEDLKVLCSAGFCTGNMYLMAARGGHLEVLRWISEMGLSVSLYQLVNARAEAAIRHSSNVELMAWPPSGLCGREIR